MSATSAPFGFRPAYNTIGLERAKRYAIASGYGTALYKGQPVTVNTNGTIVTAAGAADLKGILAGVEFVDANGKPNLQPNWPAGQTIPAGGFAYAWVWDDPTIVYEVQATGSIAQAGVGDQADAANISSGSAQTGLSQCGLGSLVGAGNQGQFRVVGFGLAPDNAPGDAYTVVQVQIARDQYVANKTAV